MISIVTYVYEIWAVRWWKSWLGIRMGLPSIHSWDHFWSNLVETRPVLLSVDVFKWRTYRLLRCYQMCNCFNVMSKWLGPSQPSYTRMWRQYCPVSYHTCRASARVRVSASSGEGPWVTYSWGEHYDVNDMMVKLMMGIIMMMVVVVKMMIAGVPRCWQEDTLRQTWEGEETNRGRCSRDSPRWAQVWGLYTSVCFD